MYVFIGTEDLKTFGVQYDNGNPILSDEDRNVVDKISSAVDGETDLPTAFWPHVSDTAVSE